MPLLMSSAAEKRGLGWKRRGSLIWQRLKESQKTTEYLEARGKRARLIMEEQEHMWKNRKKAEIPGARPKPEKLL